MSHTPGPWRQDGRLIVAGDDAVAMVNIARDVDTAHADARLIAAAPDLLAELKALAELAHNTIEVPDSVWNAIDLAEGRS